MYADERTDRDFTLARRLGRELAREDASSTEAADIIEDAFQDDLVRTAAMMVFEARRRWRVHG